MHYLPCKLNFTNLIAKLVILISNFILIIIKLIVIAPSVVIHITTFSVGTH